MGRDPAANLPSVAAEPRGGTWGISVFDADPEASPSFRKLRELLERGEYAPTVRLAYRTVFDSTVRTFGLTVPPALTDQQFLKEFLRPDMGPLTELLPQLYRFYEPVKFGRPGEGDRAALRVLLEKIYSQTALARADDPLYQSRSPQPVARTASAASRSLGTRARGEES